VRRSLALIAVGVAVAGAAAVILVGMSTGGGESAGASGDPAAGGLPSGHPSVAADHDDPEAQATHAEGDAGGGGDADPGDDIAQLEKRRRQDPGDVAVLLDLGNAYFMAQRLQQAERAYSQARALAPDSAMAQVGLAMVRHAQGDSKRAESMLRAVIEEHPDDQDAHYSLAIVCFSTGRVDEAKEQWQAAAGIDPLSTTGRRSQSFVDLLEDQQSSTPAAE
jgi:cytochrome c-type biogenesis protein CcmH/NrfG